MSIKKVMVVGSGQMGAGIAQVFAKAGMDVYLNDISEEAIFMALIKPILLVNIFLIFLFSFILST